MIRRWTYVDNAPIAEMEKKYFPDPWNFRMLAGTYLLDNFVGLVDEREGKVVGYIGATYCIDEAEITLVAVDEPYRRKGIATSLLNELFSVLKERSVERVLLEVRRSNYYAQKCYVKAGFSVLSVREGYYPDKEDALIMEKRI
ncbi:MAG: ribosomal protein S18-alanine N-acetyltransferase [Clostridia bacterium]|nr:ribosomal protein S18-alanine N-acetyltransferase [Clostridia bacterium]